MSMRVNGSLPPDEVEAEAYVGTVFLTYLTFEDPLKEMSCEDRVLLTFRQIDERIKKDPGVADVTRNVRFTLVEMFHAFGNVSQAAAENKKIYREYCYANAPMSYITCYLYDIILGASLGQDEAVRKAVQQIREWKVQNNSSSHEKIYYLVLDLLVMSAYPSWNETITGENATNEVRSRLLCTG